MIPPSLPRKRKRPDKILNENEVSLYKEASGMKTFYRRIFLIHYYSDDLHRTSVLTDKTLSCKIIEQLTLNVVNSLEYL